MRAAASGLSHWVAQAIRADGRQLAIELLCRGTPSVEQFAAAAMARARELGLGRRKPRGRRSDLARLARRGVTIVAIRPGLACGRGD